MPEEIDHIEELQKRLYTRNPEALPKRTYGILRPIRHNVESKWGETELPEEKHRHVLATKGYKRFLVVAVLFFLVALGLAAFSFFRGAITLSSKNVDLNILGNSFTAGGEELPVQIEISNRNSSDLINATLTLEYPKGVVDGAGNEVTRLTEQLGTVGSGKTVSVGFSAILYGEQGTSRDLTATLSYQLSGATATFEKKGNFSVLISTSPIALTVHGPSVVAAEQPFTMTIRSLFSGDEPPANTLVRVEYPRGYTFLSADPAPSMGDNVWSLGQLERGAEHIISLRGKVSGLEGDEKAFRIYLGTPTSETDSRLAVSYNSALHTLLIEQPFIAADISVEGGVGDSSVVSLPIGSKINGFITWQNTTGVPITLPTFTLALEGDDIDVGSLQASSGYRDELLRMLTWTATSDPALATIDPGESGTLPFSLSTKNAFSRKDIKFAFSVKGTVANGQNEIKSITNLDELLVRFASRIQFASQAFYSIGPFQNTGPYPPKVNQETSYTLSWTVRPGENPQTVVVATATLPTDITWAGVISPQTESLTYNQDSREIQWNIGSLPAATEVPVSRTVSFQVRARPTEAQAGNPVTLLSETVVRATDANAGVPLSGTRSALTTYLSTDPLYDYGDENVQR